MKRLSNKIMGMRRRSVSNDAMYNLGHDDARHDAACMAIKYDDAMAALESALNEIVYYVQAEATIDTNMDLLHLLGPCNDALAKARALDEQQAK